eukprot:COSAG05_NODE_13374_length_433_cov_0.547904_1_plen_31_part_10
MKVLTGRAKPDWIKKGVPSVASFCPAYFKRW